MKLSDVEIAADLELWYERHHSEPVMPSLKPVTVASGWIGAWILGAFLLSLAVFAVIGAGVVVNAIAERLS